MQRSLLDESIDADIEAISLEIDALNDKPARRRSNSRAVELMSDPVRVGLAILISTHSRPRRMYRSDV